MSLLKSAVISSAVLYLVNDCYPVCSCLQFCVDNLF